tara:strand:- start:2117 stop:2848 length:732 start_codon:yes stop_codon:yes gene_type:complete
VNTGFPHGVQFTPVPNPLLASLLEEINSLEELKVVLRAIHGLHKQRKPLASLGFSDLCADRTVAAMLNASGSELERRVKDAISSASDRGIFIVLKDSLGIAKIFLNTDPVRRTLIRQGIDLSKINNAVSETWPDVTASAPKQNAITYYEQNISPITALVAENIHHALQQHTEDEVILAIRKAAEANARSWNYIASILRRWANEGRPEELDNGRNGITERNPQEDRSDQFYEEYLKRQRARGAQ